MAVNTATAAVTAGASVSLYRSGIVPLDVFATMKPDNDILTHVILPRQPKIMVYQSMRNSQTDFPVLACGMCMESDCMTVVIGARPMRAVKTTFPSDMPVDAIVRQVQDQMVFGSDMRASAEYRRHLAGVFLRRGVLRLEEEYHEY